MKPFNRERFLFYMLAGIFIWQAALFTWGVYGCFKLGGLKACPDIGKRYETSVNVMVATTLALLTGGAVVGASQKKEQAEKVELTQVAKQTPNPKPTKQP